MTGTPTDTDRTDPTAANHQTGLRGLVAQHQVAAFVAGTLAFSWTVWVIAYLATGGTMSQALILPGGFGPLVAAAVVTYLTGGDVRGWARQLLDWRVRPRWYLIAVGLPAVVTATSVATVLSVTGVPLDVSALLERLPVYPIALLFMVVVGGGQEEPGWRGFALPRLQAAYSSLTASVLIGVVWAVWHLPLFVMGLARNTSGRFSLYAALVVGMSVLLTWCYNRTGGSVLVAMLFHAGVNASGLLVPATQDVVEQSALAVDLGMAVGVWLVVLVVVATRRLSKSVPRKAVPGATTDLPADGASTHD